MSVCIGCLVSAVAAGSVWAFGKANEWHAELLRRRAFAELDRTVPCQGACRIEARDEARVDGASAEGVIAR